MVTCVSGDKRIDNSGGVVLKMHPFVGSAFLFTLFFFLPTVIMFCC